MIIKVTDRSQVKPFFETLSRIVYGAIATILLLLTLVLAGDAVFQFFRVAVVGGELAEAALSGIGYVVVSVATFEIARYLTERGVMRRREIQLASVGRSLTRLVSTVAVAVFLEALVIVFHVGNENVPQLIYPTFLLIAAIMIVVGLGFYQRSEHQRSNTGSGKETSLEAAIGPRRSTKGAGAMILSLGILLIPKREFPRLCRSDSSSLSAPGDRQEVDGADLSQ